ETPRFAPRLSTTASCPSPTSDAASACPMYPPPPPITTFMRSSACVPPLREGLPERRDIRLVLRPDVRPHEPVLRERLRELARARRPGAEPVLVGAPRREDPADVAVGLPALGDVCVPPFLQVVPDEVEPGLRDVHELSRGIDRPHLRGHPGR